MRVRLGMAMLAAVSMLAACSDDDRPSSAPSASVAPSFDQSPLFVGIRAAREHDPNKEFGTAVFDPVIDRLFPVDQQWLLAHPSPGRAMTADERAAVSAALANHGGFVEAPDPERAILLGEPLFTDVGVVVAWERRCAAPPALCNSGGAVLLVERDGRWVYDKIVSSWIS